MVDKGLNLSNENFKQSIVEIFTGKYITPLSQITATPAFPTPHVLAQFAYKVYKDYKKKRETDAHYEKKLVLPHGWKLLTTASDGRRKSGYFGAAYWHPENQQVVIAHRGTKLSNLGALWEDFNGVMRIQYVRQMESASTFAYKVVEVLGEVNQEMGTSFQLFFTGHSLGGWLAQITTFTTEYLKREGDIFLGNNNEQNCCHPHTVVFDSPGCKNMLFKMTDKLNVGHDGRSIDIDHLDITTYLSAPNPINTCNAHLGTVYRIFTGLYDMGWSGKQTALYALEVRNMNKIVKAFDPETGQVYKDEQGQLKLKVVIDWPVSAGLRGGEEYKRLFKWAKNLYNYHPEIRDESFRLKSCHPIRYQTTNYDERITSLRIFSQQEQQFLQDYYRLRQLCVLYKPKEIFSVMGNNRAQEQAEKILQGFEIENDKIRCTDGSALQALIPYMKLLLQLFPKIKEKTKNALLSEEARNTVYLGETMRYVEMINKSSLDFKPDALNLRKFISSDDQVLQLKMVDGDEWTGLIKVYQVLQKTNCLTEGQYTVLTLKRFLTLNHFMDLNPLLLSVGTTYLLLMACDNNQLLDEEGEMVRNLFNTIRQNKSLKFILITPAHSSTVHFLQQIYTETFSKGVVTRNEQLKWCDLTPVSQEKLIEKQVTFQGAKISLKELMSAASPATNFLPLGALLEGKELKFADPVPISNSWSEEYYIGRAFCRQIAIKQDIVWDKLKQKFGDLLASSEQEFKQLCQLYPNSNVHWLENDKPGELLWQQSQGSLETLRGYINTETTNTYTADDLDKLLEEAEHQKMMLISDTAGMGKSTVLTHLSKQIKHKFPTKWVVRINLTDHTDALKALKKEQIDKEKAIEFVSERLLKLEPGLEMELFKQCCEEKQKLRIIIMLDGFDEISPSYKDTVIDLLQALRHTAVEQLWVTTRPDLRKELEDKLQQLSYTLEPFSEENQVEFLKKFWGLKGWFTVLDSKEEMQVETKLQNCAKELINISKLVSDKDAEITGIPLQTRILAEAFVEEIRQIFQSVESIPSLPTNLDLLGLYERFIDRKCYVYLGEKIKNPTDKEAEKKQKKMLLKFVREDHQLLALEMLFSEEQLAQLQINNHCTFSAEELTSIGIVQKSYEGKLQFIHRTFADYYVAEFLVNRLAKGTHHYQKVQSFLLKKIFTEEEYPVIRVFIDGLLSRSKPEKCILKQCGNRIHKLCQGGLKLHQAAEEGNAYIIGFYLDSLQEAEHTGTINNLLIAEDKEGHTAWHLAARSCDKEVLEILWNWSTKILTKEELKGKLLLAVDCEGKTAWHLAAEGDNIEILQKIWKSAKGTLTTEELGNKFLLAQNREEETAWHMAAKMGNVEALQYIWELAKEELKSEELDNKMLLNKDMSGFDVWLQDSEMRSIELLQKLEEVRDWAREKLITQNSNVKLLLAKDEMKETAWHVAAKQGNMELLQKLWDWAEEELKPEELSNEFLLSTNLRGKTALLYAAEVGNTELLDKLWQWAEEEQMPKGLTNKLLLATDKRQQTAFHVAAEQCHTEVLEKLWKWATEKLTTEEINNELLFAKPLFGKTAWHYAAELGNTEVLEKLWKWAKEKVEAEDLNNKFLLAKDEYKQNILHVIAKQDYKDILEKLREWSKEQLTQKDLKYKLLLAKDKCERTAWRLAADLGKPEVLEKLWDWATQVLDVEELKTSLLLAKDDMKETALHVAKQRGNTEVIKKLLEWAKAVLSTEELKQFDLDEDDTNWTVRRE